MSERLEKLHTAEEEPDSERLRKIYSAIMGILADQEKRYEEGDKNARKKAKLDLEALERVFLGKLYPTHQEEVALFFRLPRMIWDDRVMTKKKKTGEEIRFEDVSLAEQNYLFTHFILENQGDRNYLDQFWSDMAGIAKRLGAGTDFEGMKRGILAQVAAFRLLEAAGFKPKLSTPSEDIRPGVDFWAEQESSEFAVQVKGHKNQESPYLISGVGKINFFGGLQDIPSSSGEEKNIQEDKDTFRNFARRVDNFSRRHKKDIEPLLIALPEKEIDQITGTPSAELWRRVTGK